MSILINMEMPKDCKHCKFRKTELQEDPDWCLISGESLFYLAENDCPLIEIPPHGRLIDADALKSYMEECKGENAMDIYATGYARSFIDNAPTVIPADKDGEVVGKRSP